MKRNMTAAMMALAMNTVMPTVASSGCGGTPKEIVSEMVKEQQMDTQTADVTGESEKDEESSAEAASGNYGDKTIGFVGMTLNNEYHTILVNDARIETEAKGVKIEVQAGDQHASADAQLGIIKNMTANKVDGILSIPSPSDGLESALTKCKEVGIPIINLDTKLTDKSLVNVGLDIPFYGIDNCEGAKLVGEYVARNFEKGTKTAILKRIEGQTNAAGRYNGSIEGAGGTVTVVAGQMANREVDQGYTVAQNIVNANPDVELLSCRNDNMGIRALRVIKEANMQEQIQTIGFDAVSEALNLMENGEFLAIVAQYPAEMGKLGADNMLKTLDGGEAESYIDTGTEVITKDNVRGFKDYLKTFEQERGWSFETDFSYGN